LGKEGSTKLFAYTSASQGIFSSNRHQRSAPMPDQWPDERRLKIALGGSAAVVVAFGFLFAVVAIMFWNFHG
jgi:hypothetical protein